MIAAINLLYGILALSTRLGIILLPHQVPIILLKVAVDLVPLFDLFALQWVMVSFFTFETESLLSAAACYFSGRFPRFSLNVKVTILLRTLGYS
jgi:hypothetical protein